MPRRMRRQSKIMTRSTSILRMDQSHSDWPRLAPYLLLLFDRFGETGNNVYSLVTVMANVRVSKQNIAWGRGEDTEKTLHVN